MIVYDTQEEIHELLKYLLSTLKHDVHDILIGFQMSLEVRKANRATSLQEKGNREGNERGKQLYFTSNKLFNFFFKRLCYILAIIIDLQPQLLSDDSNGRGNYIYSLGSYIINCPIFNIS